MQEVPNFIRQINSCRSIHSELYKNLQAGLATGAGQKIDSEKLYRKNEPLYYALLRSLYNFEGFLTNQNGILASSERLYLDELLKYAKTLLSTIRFFPKLTYFLWQKSEGKYNKEFYTQLFDKNYRKYLALQNECAKTFIRVKRLSSL